MNQSVNCELLLLSLIKHASYARYPASKQMRGKYKLNRRWSDLYDHPELISIYMSRRVIDQLDIATVVYTHYACPPLRE
jgi:hypothetical protein